MNRHFLFMMSVLLSSGPLMAGPAKLLGPDVDGRPQIEITGAGKYFIFHAVDDDRVTCDTSLYVDVTDSGGKHWCRSFNTYTLGAIVSDPVPLDVVAPASPLEIEYRVGTSSSVDSAEYIGWSPRTTSVPADPLQAWLDTLQSNYGGIAFPSGTLALIKTASEKGIRQPVTVNYNGANRVWTFYCNNKYVALFNHQGALLGLTHTAYGDELIEPYNRIATGGANDDLRGFLFDTTVESLAPSSFPTTLNSDGSLTATWTNLYSVGFDITVDWNLSSRYSAGAPPGLTGRIRVVDTDLGNSRALKRVYFPYLFGVATGSNKELFVPKYNSGVFARSRSTVGSNIYLASGDYPSTGWQSPIAVVSRSGNTSLLMSANDPDQRAKGFSVSDLEAGNVAGRTLFSSYFQNGSVDTIESSGNVTLSPMYGNWVAASNKYRRWVDRQAWGIGSSPLPTNAGRNVDATLKKGVYWWSEPAWGGNDPLRPTSFTDDAAYQKALVGPTSGGGGIDVGFHLYSWWDKNFDTNYPQYIPTDDIIGRPSYVPPRNLSAPLITWAQSIAEVQTDGSLVAPYINAIGIDMSDAPSSSSGIVRDTVKCPVDTSGKGWWTHDFPFGSSTIDLKTLMIRKRTDNTPYASCFSGRTFAWAELGSSTWQSIVGGNMNLVFDTLGSSGIYLDSFANADASHDRATTPSGRGDWIRTDTRAFAGMAQSIAVAKGTSTTRKFVAAEFFSELTVPYVDIVLNYENPDPAAVPMLQSMYNPNQLFAGQRTKNSQSVAAKKALLGRNFVWGYQLGLSWYRYLCGYTNPSCAGTGYVDMMNYIRTLMIARDAVQDPSIGLVWSNARLVGMADGTDTYSYSGADDWCDDPGVSTDAACAATLPRLRGAFWSAAGTDLADFLVITNVGDTTLTSTFTLPSAWTGAQIVYGTGGNLSAGANTIAVGASSVVVYKATVSTDTDIDADGLADALDDDDDNDGVIDAADAFPRDAAAAVDTDHDGRPDAWNAGCDANCQAGFGQPLDTDNDGDGVLNTADNCPSVANAAQTDVDANGVGDICQHGLTARYFNDYDTTGNGTVSEGDDKLVPPAAAQRIDANVDFNWLFASPASAVAADNWSARWTGRVLPPVTGTYQFCVLGDDGIRLSVDNTELLDFWVPQDSVTNCASIALTAGVAVPIQLEFFDLTEEAIVRLKWSYPGQAQQAVPASQLYAQ